MYGVLFRFVYTVSLLTLTFAFENVDDSYDLNRVSRRYSSTIGMQDKSHLLNDFLFNKLDGDLSLDSLEIPSLNSSKCGKDILYTFQSLSNFTQNMWAYRMIDSFAKPPESGILLGNVKWVGEYNECKDVHAPPKAPDSSVGNFNGQYCTISYSLRLMNASFTLSFGVCLPDSCNPLELQDEILQLILKAGKLPVPVEEPSKAKPSFTFVCKPKEKPLTSAAISVIVLLSLLCCLSLLGSTITAVKHFRKMAQEHGRYPLIINVPKYNFKQDPERAVETHSEADDVNILPDQRSSDKGLFHNIETFLNCFCVFTNGAKLMNTDSSEGQLLCIHGIRFLSMTWVILGHAYISGNAQIRNMVEASNVLDEFAFQVVAQGFFSVDSFFVLSGFLMTYLFMKEISKTKGSFNWPYFYIHRYIRLTPSYMIVLGFFASVFLYVGSGPYWPVTDHDAKCQENWWWNLLYINNFKTQAEMCMVWSWYLANDMQFFVISPIFLISLWKWPKIGYSVCGLFLAASMFANFFITYHYDIATGLAGLPDSKDVTSVMAKFVEFFDKIYSKPYCRIGSYLIGMIAGYILFKHKTSNRPKLSSVQLSVGWIVASSVTLTCVYGLYHAHPSLIARSIFNAVNRSLFACSLSWVIYVCLTEQSNIINSILSYKLFIPLSRLTYSAYLLHPLVMMGYFYNLKASLEFSHPTLVLLFLGFVVVTYALAFPVSLILESPIVSLEKLIRKKFTRKPKEPCQ